MKLSLRKKLGILVILMALLLSGTAGLISYRVYTNIISQHYGKLAMNVSATAAQMVDAQLVKRYRDQVVEIYKKSPSPVWDTKAEEEAYFEQYQTVVDGDYEKVKEMLEKIRVANQADSLYIVYADPETMTCVYIMDPDPLIRVGTWDVVAEQNYEAMTHPEDGFPAYITTTEYGWLCTAGAAILDSSGQVVAHALTDISMTDIVRESREFMILLLGGLVAVTSLCVFVLAFLTERAVARPINRLAAAAASFVSRKTEGDTEGDTEESAVIGALDIRTGDEIEELCNAIKQMEIDINEYISNLSRITAEKERISAELGVATQIQADMLPRTFPPYPDRREFDIYASMNPAREVGGDFYDFFLVDEGHLAVVIADVSGKGVPAALFMVIARTLIKNQAQQGLVPAEIFSRVNNQLCEGNEAGLFVTAWLGILDLGTGALTYVNAGHNPPYYMGQDGVYRQLKAPAGLVLAAMEGMPYSQQQITMEPGDQLYLYTDGVTEAENPAEELFGEKRLEQVLEGAKGKAPKEIVLDVQNALEQFADGAEQFDDITMLLLRYMGNRE